MVAQIHCIILPCLLSAVAIRYAELSSGVAGIDDFLNCLQEIRVVELPGNAHSGGQIIRPDEHAGDAINANNIINVFQAADGFTLRNKQCLFIGDSEPVVQ